MSKILCLLGKVEEFGIWNLELGERCGLAGGFIERKGASLQWKIVSRRSMDGGSAKEWRWWQRSVVMMMVSNGAQHVVAGAERVRNHPGRFVAANVAGLRTQRNRFFRSGKTSSIHPPYLIPPSTLCASSYSKYRYHRILPRASASLAPAWLSASLHFPPFFLLPPRLLPGPLSLSPHCSAHLPPSILG